ncbi:MAG TPA: H-NS family nucleoid-associated regulatory protein [Aquabacterium sp.]|nr:H-NS family nucleoid-associated regulatory protein [Aquabacterium sp.]
MSNYMSVTAEIARLQAQAEKLKQSEKAGVIAQARKAIEVYGITATELFGASGRGGNAAAAPAKAASGNFGVPKYRDPKTGKTWTGRGKPPTWIVGAKDRDAFLIPEGEALGAEAVKGVKGRKAASKAAGPTVGVPKYRDAKTGKTWTGRGKPPLWIAGATNRDDFLIKPQ